MSESYSRLLRQLAELSARTQAQRAEAEQWYAGRRQAADRAVREAADALDAAQAELAAAREQAETVDAEAAHLWRTLGERLGLSRRRTGAPPVPAQGPAADPVALLGAVRDLVELARKPGALPSSANPLLVLFGVLGAAVAFAVGAAARAAGHRYGGDLAVGLPVLSLVATLLGPVVGLVPARLLADRRHATLGPRPMAVVCLAGVVTTGVLFALLR
jgi:hypothetical protein